MKIEKRGILITDLPNGAQIETSGELITLTISPFSATPDQVREIRDAITEALQSLAGQAAANTAGPWSHLSEVPENISRVWDRDGDELNRNSLFANGWEIEDLDRWSRKYGPFRAQL